MIGKWKFTSVEPGESLQDQAKPHPGPYSFADGTYGPVVKIPENAQWFLDSLAKPSPEDCAAGRLMAKAPEMLELLRQAYDVLNEQACLLGGECGDMANSILQFINSINGGES